MIANHQRNTWAIVELCNRHGYEPVKYVSNDVMKRFNDWGDCKVRKEPQHRIEERATQPVR